jgi:segregation and condensation protein B
MVRVKAMIFASAELVSRETLSRVVGKDCSIDLLIDDIVEELRDRPYELAPSQAARSTERVRGLQGGEP